MKNSKEEAGRTVVVEKQVDPKGEEKKTLLFLRGGEGLRKSRLKDLTLGGVKEWHYARGSVST